LNFYKNNFPNAFFIKERYGFTFFDGIGLNSSKLTEKYLLKFLISYFPFLFLEKKFNKRFKNMGSSCAGRNTLFFCTFNFPEISNRTNNFILPLIMEIQN